MSQEQDDEILATPESAEGAEEPEEPRELEELPEERKEPATSAMPPAWELDPIAPEWRDAMDDPLVAALLEDFDDVVESARSFAGDLTVQVRRDAIAEVCASLKEKHRFLLLVDLCGVDHAPRTPRFDVLYVLHGFESNRRIRLRVQSGEETPVPTVSKVWRGADWLEREVWDLLGVRFADHPDLTRILLWEGFEGHPLRKDFPLERTGA
jgi:NADH-quinone oxidoreductase subunit C